MFQEFQAKTVWVRGCKTQWVPDVNMEDVLESREDFKTSFLNKT